MVMFELTTFAIDRPMIVAVPDEIVGVIVEGLPDVPMFAVAFDLNAMCYPNAIAIAVDRSDNSDLMSSMTALVNFN